MARVCQILSHFVLTQTYYLISTEYTMRKMRPREIGKDI